MLRKMLRYEPETGNLYWRERTPDMFTATSSRSVDHKCNNWNSGNANKEAFTAKRYYGYRVGGINNIIFRAHRVIWAIVHGVWPEGEIDHINHDTDDNRICNLRAVTHYENGRNQKLRKSNTSGTMGVCWAKERNMWCSRAKTGGKTIHLGYFLKKSDAISARKAAEIEYGYHANHGKT